MDFSPWDWADSFRLHEAACLIAGVEPLSKRVPDREELPARAVPVYGRLAKAYVYWVLWHDKPEKPEHPKAMMLQASPADGGEKPILLVPLERLTGEPISREELHRWIRATGQISAYQFRPPDVSIDRTQPVAALTQAAPEPEAPPEVTGSASGDVETATKAGWDNEKPWMAIDPSDPEAKQPWYTPARYFARHLIIHDSTLLVKKLVLADKVARSLVGVGIFKRGGKRPHDAATVLKAFTNVQLG